MTDLIVNPDTNVLVVRDGTSEESYSLERVPDPGSALVRRAKAEILQELSLDTVLTNLERSGDLMFVAYNGVAGYEGGRLTARMSGLQKTLADLCNDCVVSGQSFERSSATVLGYLIDTFKFLLRGQEVVAVAKLARCEGAAKEMADESEALARRFAAVAETTEKVLEETQVAQGAQFEKKAELERQMREITVQQEKLKVLQEEVSAAATEMQERYAEAREREEVESTRAFVLGLTSAITSTIGSGVAAFAAARNPLSALMGAGTPQPQQPTPGKEGQAPAAPAGPSAEVESARAAASELEQKAEAARKEADEAAGAADTADQAAQAQAAAAREADEKAKKAREEAQAAADGEAAKRAAALEAEAQQLKAQAEESRRKAEQARARAETARAAAQAVGASLREASERLSKLSDNAQKAAEALRSEKMQYLNQKLALQKQNREALASIAEYAEKMKSTTVERGIADSAVESLQMAVRSLKQIVTSLLNASLFWRSMEQYCRALSKAKLREDIEDVRSLPLEDRLAYYHDVDFMGTAVYYIARWKALEVVCGEYRQAAFRARGKVLDNIAASPSIEDSRKLAPALAEQMLERTRHDLEVLDGRTRELDQERAALAPAA